LDLAMGEAIATNPELAARAARVEARKQSTPIAIAEALPQIVGTATAEKFDRDDPSQRLTGSRNTETWRGGGSFQQLVYGSGRVRAAVSQARAEYRAEAALFGEASNILLMQTVRAYADVREARAALEAQNATRENLLQQKRYVDANQKKGFLTVTDVAQAQARIASSEGQAARARAEVVTAERAFVRIVGRLPGDLPPPAPVDGLPATLDEAYAAAARNRKAVESARQQVRAADAAIAFARSGGGPRLTLEASSFFDNSFNAQQADRVIDDTVTMRLTLPVFSGGAVRARTKQQRALRSAARLDLAYTLRQIEETVTTAWASLDAARIERASAEAGVAAAELAVRGVKREQANGLRSVFEVLDQEQTLLNARLALARAERDLAVAERQMLFETGMLSCATCESPRTR
jgi:TolC family type I secretion outer membrane protein